MDPISHFTSIPTLMDFISYLRDNDFEDKFKTLANLLLTLYFPVTHGFVVGPERRIGEAGIPDFGVYRISLDREDGFEDYCYVEVKRAGGRWLEAEGQLGSTMASLENPCYAIILVGRRLRFYIVDCETRGHGYGHGLIPIVPEGWPTNTIWDLTDQDHQAEIDFLFRKLGSENPAAYADR